MYLWQKLVAPRWWETNEQALSDQAGKDLAIIEQPGRNRLTIEVACSTRRSADALVRRFGGRFEKLPRNWLDRFARMQKTEPLRIGQRLLITNVEGTSGALGGLPLSRRQGRSHIVIPAGAAFGTGQHITTAMVLRLLEQLTRTWDLAWSLADLGTGSGILALAAKRLGARSVLGVDIDDVAISTARANARRNRIKGIEFQIADVTRRTLAFRPDVVTANLFSELLIEILPKLKRARWLILSGVLRAQEPEVVRALRRNGFEPVKIRRRGKWIALLATTN